MKHLRLGSLVLATLGLVDSLYLTWIKLTNNTAICLPGLGNCDVVNNSRFSEIGGIPIAALGAAAYFSLLFLILAEKRDLPLAEYYPYGVFGITLSGTIYSAYLTYLEIAIIKAICPFCLLSAIIMASLFIIAIVRLSQD